MSQASDYTIDNSTGANVRADINTVLGAIATNNSGGSDNGSIQALGFFANTSSSKLQLKNAAGNAFINLRGFDGTLPLPDGSNSAPSLFFDDDTNTGIYSSAADTFNVATGGVERMELGATTIFNEDGADVDFRIEGDSQANLFYVDAGNDRVGIATASPNSTLDVNGDITITDKIIHGGDTNTAIRFPSTDTFAVETAGAEVMRVTSTARVGIGTNNPLYPLHVKGLVANASPADFGVLMGLSSGDDYAQIQLNGDTGAFIDFSTSGVDQKGRILYVHANERFEFFVNSGKRMQLTGDGLILNGTDTAAANALDDYEEGTWTPTLNSGNSLAASDGRYVKIGTMVYAFWEITLNTNSQSAHMIINNLPFTSINSEPSSGGTAKDYQTYDIENGPIYHVPKNNTHVQFYKNSGQNFAESNGSGLNFRACSIYQAAS